MPEITNENEVMDSQFNNTGVNDSLGWKSLDGVKTPDQEMMESEEHEMELDQRSRDGVRAETLNGMLAYFLREFGKNGSALDVGKRVIAMAKFCDHRSVNNFSATQLAKACGETPATMTERVRRECNQIIEAMGGVAQAKWQQGPTQRGVSAQVQMGNNNRVKNLGKKGRVTLAERRGN